LFGAGKVKPEVIILSPFFNY
jgi:hypothetical protein